MIDAERLLYPLDEFYARAGLALPPVQLIPGDVVPEPYRTLLVHDHDMTPTLEAFHRERIHLRVIERRLAGDSLCRQVVLTLDESERPVEFGAIVIHCGLFPPPARELILEGRCPLGTILADHRIEHASCPRAFLRVRSDAIMNGALGLEEPRALYGRRNVLSAPDGRVLAEVVEILPPLP
jgi:chorismate-pyruvate lyase